VPRIKWEIEIEISKDIDIMIEENEKLLEGN